MRLNVGRDLGVSLFQKGAKVPYLLITGFSFGQREDGQWYGQISVDRSSPDFELMQAKNPVFLIRAVNTEHDGATTEYIFHDAVLRFSCSGGWYPDAVVAQNVVFTSKARTMNGFCS